jgi:diaminopimelate epimerase
MGSTLRFAKYEGLGNDFVIVDGRTQDLSHAAEAAVALCDRHRGVGADGVLLVDVRGGVPSMRVINADGSRPEMCGNGLRCAALYLKHSGSIAGEVELTVNTDAGPHRCRVWREGDVDWVQVEMRAASLDSASIPVLQAAGPVVEQPFEVDGTRLSFTCVSMGNPHAVTFDDVGAAARVTLGPRFGTHPRFPQGANIGFARVVGPQRIELAVWERGAGFTLACGTGACACAVAAVETGRATRGAPIEVQLPGGPLRIVVGAPGAPIEMTGPARAVFQGEYPA